MIEIKRRLLKLIWLMLVTYIFLLADVDREMMENVVDNVDDALRS
jgi:hypothetical protein